MRLSCCAAGTICAPAGLPRALRGTGQKRVDCRKRRRVGRGMECVVIILLQQEQRFSWVVTWAVPETAECGHFRRRPDHLAMPAATANLEPGTPQDNNGA